MLKKRAKWIALGVAVTFAWMLQVSSMPLAAAGATEQVGAANAGSGPDFVEVAGAASAPAKSKSILPYVLIGVGVVAVAAVLVLVVFKTTYDIVGSWNVSYTFTAGYSGSGSGIFVFSGTKASGSLVDPYGYSGTYTVDGKKVSWTISGYDPGFTWTGQFSSKDAMSGSLALPAEGVTGTWTATRVGATAALPDRSAPDAATHRWK
jgi:hypothetical protein